MNLNNMNFSTNVDVKSEKNFSEKVKETVKAIPLAVSLAVGSSCIPAEANNNYNNNYNHFNQSAYQVEINKFSTYFGNNTFNLKDIIGSIQEKEGLPKTYELDTQTVNVLNEKYYPLHKEVGEAFLKSENFIIKNKNLEYNYKEFFLFDLFKVNDKFSLYFAIKDFQEKNGIEPVDGIYGQETDKKIFGTKINVSQNNNFIKNNLNSVKKTSSVSEEDLQKFIDIFSYSSVLGLESSIKDIQRLEGMERIDGILGPKTLAILEEKYYPKVEVAKKGLREGTNYLIKKYGYDEEAAIKTLYGDFEVTNYLSLYFSIRNFQKSVGIKEDGSFGETTEKELDRIIYFH